MKWNGKEMGEVPHNTLKRNPLAIGNHGGDRASAARHFDGHLL
jgi:hypothetical protein